MRSLAVTLAFALALMLMTALRAATPADPYTGIWTLNPARSGGEARSQVLTISVAGNEETYRSELVQRDGTRQVTNYRAAYDGKEHPSQTTLTDAAGKTSLRDDTVILRKVDALTRERHWKRDGRVIRILRRRVSADGSTLTSQVIDVDEHGREHAAGTLVFERAQGR